MVRELSVRGNIRREIVHLGDVIWGTVQLGNCPDTNKNIYMKIEFQNLISRLSFFCCITDIKIAWINPCSVMASR